METLKMVDLLPGWQTRGYLKNPMIGNETAATWGLAELTLFRRGDVLLVKRKL